MKSYILLILMASGFLGAALSNGFLKSALAAEGAAHEHNHNDYELFSFPLLIKPLGICALSSLLITFLIGLFRRRLGRRFLKVHRAFAFLTVIIALFHGILVLVLL